MKKLKLLLPLAAIAAASGVALPIVSCGCSNTTTFNVAIEGNATIDNTQAEKDKEFKGVITAKDTFALVGQESIKSVKVGSTALTKDTDYTWDGLTSTITIVAEKVTGDITITVETGKQEVVEDEDDFITALEDETVAEIVLPKTGIELPAPITTGPGLDINRSLTIAGPSSTEITPLNLPNNASNVGIAIGVDETNEDASGIDVTLKNLDVRYDLTSGNVKVVDIENFNNSNINIVNTNINYDESNVGEVPAYGLYISPVNILGATINIENSKIQGYGAIYNQGSNIKLTANNSTFEGNNYDDDDSSQFTTITVADNPLMPEGWEKPRSFSANNEFTFDKCTIVADDWSDSEWRNHQTIAEIQSIANNHLYLNNTDCISKYSGEVTEEPVKFFNVDEDQIIANDKTGWLHHVYTGADKPVEIKSYRNYVDYYANTKSSIYIDDVLAVADGYYYYIVDLIEDENKNVVWDWLS